MEVVRKIVDAKKLMSVIPLPETMRNRRVEVIVLPAEEQKVSENLKKSQYRIFSGFISRSYSGHGYDTGGLSR